jgi:hypothetical protein
MSLLQRLRHGLEKRRHSALLASIVVAFSIRPVLGEGPVIAAAFSLAMVLLLLVALYATSLDELVGDRERLRVRRHRRHVVAWMLAVPAVVERILVVVTAGPGFFLVSALCWMLFLGYITWIELRSVLEQRQVTNETISMAISVYLLMGMTWAMLYFAIFEVNPQSLSFQQFPGLPTDVASSAHTHLPLFVYFSLSTISTLGFGDIMPVSLAARYAAVAEGITGQLYVAILVARLVSMQVSGSLKKSDD